MSDFFADLYHMTEASLKPDFLNDPEYLRCKEHSDRLWDEIAADLGAGGSRRLDALKDAESDEDRFWQMAMFRRTLALGLELGRLPLTV